MCVCVCVCVVKRRKVTLYCAVVLRIIIFFFNTKNFLDAHSNIIKIRLSCLTTRPTSSEPCVLLLRNCSILDLKVKKKERQFFHFFFFWLFLLHFCWLLVLFLKSPRRKTNLARNRTCRKEIILELYAACASQAPIIKLQRH